MVPGEVPKDLPRRTPAATSHNLALGVAPRARRGPLRVLLGLGMPPPTLEEVIVEKKKEGAGAVRETWAEQGALNSKKTNGATQRD